MPCRTPGFPSPESFQQTISVLNGRQVVVRPADKLDGISALAYAKQMFVEASWWVETEPDEFVYTAQEESCLFDECDWEHGQQFWLAVMDDRVIGMCSVGVSKRRKLLHVGSLGISVAADCRGQGVSRAMMGVCLAYSRALPALLKIELCVFPDNVPALKLYQGFGFVEEGRQKRGSRRADGSFVDNMLMGIWLEDSEEFTSKPVVETMIQIDEALRLRLCEPEIAQDIYHVIDANRDFLGRYMAWVASATVESVRKNATKNPKMAAARAGAQYAIWGENRVMGVVALKDWKDEVNKAFETCVSTAEIGYWLAEDATGRGIMTRAVSAMVEAAFDRWGIQRLTICVNPENPASRAVAERAGFRLEGRMRDALCWRGVWEDHLLFALTQDQWRQERGELATCVMD